jgi:hypothetical protein
MDFSAQTFHICAASATRILPKAGRPPGGGRKNSVGIRVQLWF